MATLKEILEQNKITEITVYFSGSGDSGGIDEIEISADGALSKEVKKAIENEMSNFAYDEMSKAMGGFEINEGGGGKLTLKFDDNQWISEINGYYNYEESEIDQDLDIPLDDSQRSAIEDLLGEHLMDIDKISIEYYGSGDSGGIENVSFSKDYKNLEEDETLRKATNELTNFFENLVDEYHPGFEINNGGEGLFNVTLSEGKISNVHLTSSYYTLNEEPEYYLVKPDDIEELLNKEITIEKAKEKSKGAEL
jgi:hypothetical protein